MRVVVLGAGAVGCFLGGCLQASGVKVSYIGRQRIKNIVTEFGLTVSDWKGRLVSFAPEAVDYHKSGECLTYADIILVTVKSGDTASAAKTIKEYASPRALVVSFQNGVCNSDVLRANLPGFKVLSGMIPFNVAEQPGGRFHSGTEGDLFIEELDDAHRSLLNLFQGAGVGIVARSDMASVQWSKLVLNLNNSINALSGLALKEQLMDRTYRQVVSAATAEGLTVLKAAGITPVRTGKVVPQLVPHVLKLPNFMFLKVASAMIKIDESARSSMQDDLRLGRRTEVDYLNGEIVKLAARVGVEAPVNSRIVDLLKAAEAAGRGSPKMSANALYTSVLKPAVKA
ncbi:2-dehydropantoate 2-reductase [Oleiphilus messinensis]|uniref:2-dehydropantoate 2-reductase n=1 Tax=Oleiphilus messinensis TaxID=141451 RepID=A0A1Y0I373_9GAMM|nr:2-dehydropantoate 2-reductase [Oleiphilus messinensis]ARU54710.1 2-dehydropantoate 2-reductase [Oleiphilus messinensis]